MRLSALNDRGATGKLQWFHAKLVKSRRGFGAGFENTYQAGRKVIPEPAGNSVDIASGSRIAVNGGYILTVKPQGVEVSGGDNLYARWNEGVSDVMGYLGIDASKDFTVNGMKYSKNGNGWFESQADSEAKSAYEMLKANNRTYTFADERTRNQIDYISGYYLEHTLETLLLRIKEFLLWSY